MAKPSTTKRQEATNFLNRLKGYAFDSDWTAINKAINDEGVKSSHWEVKYNNLVGTKEGWKTYLSEDDIDETNETQADQELGVRMDGVADVFANSVVKYYADRIKYETSWGTTQTLWTRFKSYLDDTANQGQVEKDFIGKDPLKKLIADTQTLYNTRAGTHTGGTGTNALPIVGINGYNLIGFHPTETTAETPIFGIGWKLIGFETP